MARIEYLYLPRLLCGAFVSPPAERGWNIDWWTTLCRASRVLSFSNGFTYKIQRQEMTALKAGKCPIRTLLKKRRATFRLLYPSDCDAESSPLTAFKMYVGFVWNMTYQTSPDRRGAGSRQTYTHRKGDTFPITPFNTEREILTFPSFIQNWCFFFSKLAHFLFVHRRRCDVLIYFSSSFVLYIKHWL